MIIAETIISKTVNVQSKKEKSNIKSRENYKLSNLPRFSYSMIIERLEILSYTIGQERKLVELRNLIKKLEKKREVIHEQIPSTPSEEKQDWNKAVTYFVNNVIDGWNNFAYQLDENCYQEIKAIYIDDLKELKAYHFWLASEMSEDDPINNYLESCEFLNRKLFDPEIKASVEKYVEIGNYINNDYKFNKHELIKNKAQRISENKVRLNIQSSDLDDWLKAEYYINIFYSNIQDAIYGVIDKMEKILKVFREDGRKYSIINCFEAAVTIYFFDQDIVKQICDGKEWDYNDIF